MNARSRAEGARWLADALVRLDRDDPRAATETLCSWIRAEPPALQVAVLKACVDRLPVLRIEARAERSAYRLGSILYGVACELYGDRLPHREDDICELLRASKHDCGHGGDVTGPFDLAIDHARRFGLSRELVEALGEFIEGLRGLQSIKAKNVKRRAALLFVLDTDGDGNMRPCWSDRFRLGLAALPAEERAMWHQLVLQMSIAEQPRLPKAWQKTSTGFIDAMGVVPIAKRFGEWWPTPRPEPWALESGGSQLLRHFIWTLQIMRARASVDERPLCDALVRQLALVDWKPRERAKKVAVAAASYLVECTPDVASDALQRLGHWSTALKYADWEPNRIAVLGREFARTHGLDIRGFAAPHAVKKPASPTQPAPNAPGLAQGSDEPRPSEPPESWYGRILGALRRALSFGQGGP